MGLTSPRARRPLLQSVLCCTGACPKLQPSQQCFGPAVPRPHPSQRPHTPPGVLRRAARQCSQAPPSRRAGTPRHPMPGRAHTQHAPRPAAQRGAMCACACQGFELLGMHAPMHRDDLPASLILGSLCCACISSQWAALNGLTMGCSQWAALALHTTKSSPL